uniref:ribosomal protein L9 n=1 Tax=Stylonema alsidii TaxID=35155 RepID=UPI001FCDE7DE|nr:ribosomal protein L9 [Stylonema alsidii]UNJ15213.1 ribosomal protein L9 [Stylonema alsidii]
MVKQNVPVLLKTDITSLGKVGSLVKVKPGYARNYLIPQNLAVFATPKIIQHAASLFEAEQAKVRLAKEASESLRILLEQIQSITIKKTIGKNNAIFGTVTEKEVADLLSNLIKQSLDKKQIEIPEIKTTGNYFIQIKLNYNIQLSMKLYVLPTAILN